VNGVAQVHFVVQFSNYGHYGFSAQYMGGDVSAPSVSNNVTVWI
jgi:hypothetical protein